MVARRPLRLSAIMVLLGGLVAVPSFADNTPQEDKELYELFKVFVDTLDQVERNYVKEIDRRILIEAAIKGMIDKLDPYSNYISPEDLARFKRSVESKFGGVGIQIGVNGGNLTIISPLAGTPAYRAGLHSGDHIVEIEGKTTKGISLDQAVKRLKGPAGTSVKIKVRKAFTTKTRDVILKREVIRIQTVLADSRKSNDNWDYMFDHEKKIGYIRVTGFSRETYNELRVALKELEGEELRGLIVDLRFNPGGLLDVAIKMCDLFVSEGKIVSTKGRNTKERKWEASKTGTFEGFPVAILVNRFSASASEIFAACLQDHNRAIVIGERTWGKGSVQNVIDLEEGKSALKLTTASYWRPSGKNIHREEGAKESDEWGVKPNEGFKLRLDDGEMRALVEYRRKRDVLVWTEDDAQQEENKEDDPEEAKDESDDDSSVEDGSFVDRQFKKAMEYIVEQQDKDKKAVSKK